MQLITILLSIVLVLNALFLILLILIQLPKKDAGAGLAFGAGATDALFGAGSGNALTKMTKYAATFFLVLVLGLSYVGKQSAGASERRLQLELERSAKASAQAPLPVGTLAATNSDVRLEVKNLPPTNSAAADTNRVAQATNNPASKAP